MSAEPRVLLERIESCIRGLRGAVSPSVGTMSPLYDWIAELEEIRDGKPGLLSGMSAEEKVSHCEGLLDAMRAREVRE